MYLAFAGIGSVSERGLDCHRYLLFRSRSSHLELLYLVGSCSKVLILPVANLTGYARRSSTAKKANRPIKIRRTATAMTGDCIFSFVASALIPAIGAKDSPHR